MLIHATTAEAQNAIQEARRQRARAFLALFRRTKPNPETHTPGCDMAPA